MKLAPKNEPENAQHTKIQNAQLYKACFQAGMIQIVPFIISFVKRAKIFSVLLPATLFGSTTL